MQKNKKISYTNLSIQNFMVRDELMREELNLLRDELKALKDCQTRYIGIAVASVGAIFFHIYLGILEM